MSALSVESIENVSTKPLESILGFHNDELAYPPGQDVGAQVDRFEDLVRQAAFRGRRRLLAFLLRRRQALGLGLRLRFVARLGPRRRARALPHSPHVAAGRKQQRRRRRRRRLAVAAAEQPAGRPVRNRTLRRDGFHRCQDRAAGRWRSDGCHRLHGNSAGSL